MSTKKAMDDGLGPTHGDEWWRTAERAAVHESGARLAREARARAEASGAASGARVGPMGMLGHVVAFRRGGEKGETGEMAGGAEAESAKICHACDGNAGDAVGKFVPAAGDTGGAVLPTAHGALALARAVVARVWKRRAPRSGI